MAATQQGAISKRRKFVADGVFYAELNELLQRELAEEGYSGVEVRVTPTVTDISTFRRNPTNTREKRCKPELD
jgi:small subunit ribosomal protein S3e